MIYINEQLVNFRNKNKDYEFADIVKDYHKVIKENQEYYGEFLNIETSVRPRRDAKTRALRYPGARGLLLTSTINREIPDENDPDHPNVVTEQIMYSPTILRKGDHGEWKDYSPNLLVHKGVYSFKIQDNPDLAYFVLTCGKVGKTPAEGKKFHLYDVKKINSSNAERRKLEGAVLNLIYSTLPEGKLRTLGKSFGVSDVNLKDINSVREELFAKLTDAEDVKKRRPDSKLRGFKEFIETSEVKLHDQISALCYDAQNDGFLNYNVDERRWEIDYKDGGRPYILKELAGTEYGDPMGSLVSFLLADENKLRKIEKAMGLATVDDSPEDTGVPKYTPEMILKEHNVPKLKKILKELDPDIELKRDASGEHVRLEILKRIPAE